MLLVLYWLYKRNPVVKIDSEKKKKEIERRDEDNKLSPSVFLFFAWTCWIVRFG